MNVRTSLSIYPVLVGVQRYRSVVSEIAKNQSEWKMADRFASSAPASDIICKCVGEGSNINLIRKSVSHCCMRRLARTNGSKRHDFPLDRQDKFDWKIQVGVVTVYDAFCRKVAVTLIPRSSVCKNPLEQRFLPRRRSTRKDYKMSLIHRRTRYFCFIRHHPP